MIKAIIGIGVALVWITFFALALTVGSVKGAQSLTSKALGL